MSEAEPCAFCGKKSPLRDSHVLPAFVFRWLRDRSGTGHIRHTETPNKRVQDGLKLKLLCGECESLFNRYETAFASRVFYPWLAGNYQVGYGDWLSKFCVSVSWRVLRVAYGKNPETKYTDEQRRLIADADFRWRAFLDGKSTNPGTFEQHLVIFDLIVESSVSELPSNFNRFMTGAVTFDIIGSERSLMTFAKLGRFIIFGIIQSGAHKWEGTKIKINNGILRPRNIALPHGLLSVFMTKATQVSDAFQKMSPVQRDKIDRHVFTHIDAFAASEQFKAIEADCKMFGEEAFVREQ